MKKVTVASLRKKLLEVKSVAHNSFVFRLFVRSLNSSCENLSLNSSYFYFQPILSNCYQGAGKYKKLMLHHKEMLVLLDELGLSWQILYPVPPLRSKVHVKIVVLDRIYF